MPRAYFEPESLDALAEVFAEAKRRLNSKDINDPTALDTVASRILALAAEGLPPSMILREIEGQEGLCRRRVTQNQATDRPTKRGHPDGGTDAS